MRNYISMTEELLALPVTDLRAVVREINRWHCVLDVLEDRRLYNKRYNMHYNNIKRKKVLSGGG